MTIRLLTLAAAMTLGASTLPVSAQVPQGYQFQLALSHKNVSHDPDGIWADADLVPFGNPPHLPSIYTATLSTHAGTWTLSQVDNQCTMQSDCAFILVLRSPDGNVRKMASGSTLLGGEATLSLNYKKIITKEVDDEAKPFDGSYDVGAH